MSLFDEMMEEQSEYEKAIEGLKEEADRLRKENKKLNNMYTKEYNEHMEKKRQNGVLINNELILKRKIEELEVENKTLKETEPVSIPISVIQNTLEDIDKKEKEELKGLKGQDRYFVKQMYQYMRKPLDEILEKGNK